MKNSDIEKLWVDAWNDLYEITGSDDAFLCVLPDGTCVSPDACRGWLQSSVYAGYRVQVARGLHLGRPAVVVQRQLRADAPPPA